MCGKDTYKFQATFCCCCRTSCQLVTKEIKGNLGKYFFLVCVSSASLANLLLSHAHAEMHVNHPNKNLVLVLTKEWQPWSICTPCEMMSLYSCESTFSQWCYFWIPRSDQKGLNNKKTTTKQTKNTLPVLSWRITLQLCRDPAEAVPRTGTEVLAGPLDQIQKQLSRV